MVGQGLLHELGEPEDKEPRHGTTCSRMQQDQQESRRIKLPKVIIIGIPTKSRQVDQEHGKSMEDWSVNKASYSKCMLLRVQNRSQEE